MDHNNDYKPPFGNNDEITPPNENPSDVIEETSSEPANQENTFSYGSTSTNTSFNATSNMQQSVQEFPGY